MTKLNCKPGDLAVVITAHNPENIGTIVRVIKKHHNQNALVDFKGSHIWMALKRRGLCFTMLAAKWLGGERAPYPTPYCGLFVD